MPGRPMHHQTETIGMINEDYLASLFGLPTVSSSGEDGMYAFIHASAPDTMTDREWGRVRSPRAVARKRRCVVSGCARARRALA